jgi:hypothetical protein
MNNKLPIEDLKYELHLLLGAAQIVEALEEFNKNNPDTIGNLINYFKDSAYIHTRNLYNFFAADTKNDAKVTQYINNHLFNLALYQTWIGALHDHVLHIKTKRGDVIKSNLINGKYLNEMVPCFASDIEQLWNVWVKITPDATLKTRLKNTLSEAQTCAKNDSENLIRLLSVGDGGFVS